MSKCLDELLEIKNHFEKSGDKEFLETRIDLMCYESDLSYKDFAGASFDVLKESLDSSNN